SSYGTIVDSGYRLVSLPVVDVNDFNERVIRGYEEGWAEKDLPADLSVARSLVPAGTATLRDFSYISPEIPEYIAEDCTGCKNCGPSNPSYVSESLLIDMMLKEQTHVYTGGAGSCAGCGEGTALRMLCAATGSKYGDQWGIIAATGCNTVYTSTYPYNPYLVPWTNSLFENAPAMAMGVRSRWDQMGWQDRPLWCLGGDGAMFDIGFQALSRLLASGMNIKVFVLDTQVYSNTGGQASTSSYTGQNTKMSVHGKAIAGKQERRKEIAQIAMMHPRTFVAQTTCAHVNHFYKSVIDALEFDGP